MDQMTEKEYSSGTWRANIYENVPFSDQKSEESIQKLKILSEVQLTSGGIWKWILLIVAVVLLIGLVSLAAINGMETSLELPSPNLPPILWILTARDINNSRLNPTFFGHHLQYVANKSGFEPRFVDHESAYQWLSDPVKDIVTKAMHRRRYELSVEDFLRLALIIEHGGISLLLGDAILIEELDWIKNIFQNPLSNKTKDILHCPLNSSPELFMFNNKGLYSDLFIAAQKNSSLLWAIFLQMADAVQKGTPSLKSIQAVHPDTKAIFIKKPFQFLLNAHLSQGSQSSCQKWGLQSVEVDSSINKIYKCSKGVTQFLNEKDRFPIMKECELRFMINIQGMQQKITNIFNKALQNKPLSIEDYHSSSLIGEYFLQLQPLQKYLKPLDQNRNVHFCVVSLKTIPKLQARKTIYKSLRRLKRQKFSKWNAVYFVDQEGDVDAITAELNTTVLQASIYEGLNLQTAVTQHCPHHSIVFLLDFDESLSSRDNLEQASQIFSERSVYAGLVPLQINSSRKNPPEMNNILRIQFNPNVENLNTITNHLRVFNSDYYCMLSHTDLHNVEGEYFDRAIPFMGMLDMAANMSRCYYRADQAFEVKRMRQKIDFPQKRVVLPFAIRTNTFKTVDGHRPQFYFKFPYLSFCSNLQQSEINDNWLWNGKDNIVRNLGVKYQSPKERKQMPKIIPRKIHFIWIQGQINLAKKYIMNEAKRLHPEFETFLWSRANITRENFPYTYDILQTLLYFHQAGSYLKYASLADIMRIEIVYQQGGFYLDTNHLWFEKGSLQDWRSYELLMAGQLSPRLFIMAANTPFGSYPKNPRLLRLLKPEALSRVRIFDRAASICTGPGYSKHLISGQTEESDLNVLRPSMEQLVPIYSTDINFCLQNGVREENADFILIKDGLGFRKNCSKYYPPAYAVDVFDLGGSWKRKK